MCPAPGIDKRTPPAKRLTTNVHANAFLFCTSDSVFQGKHTPKFDGISTHFPGNLRILIKMKIDRSAKLKYQDFPNMIWVCDFRCTKRDLKEGFLSNIRES